MDDKIRAARELNEAPCIVWVNDATTGQPHDSFRYLSERQKILAIAPER